jgi:hypothetical protein
VKKWSKQYDCFRISTKMLNTFGFKFFSGVIPMIYVNLI